MNRKKQIYSYCIALMGLLLSTSLSIAQNPVKDNGQLSVKGTGIVNGKGDKVILRGASLGWHQWWPRFFEPQTIGWLKKDFKCNIVRVPVGVEPESAYLDNPQFGIDCATRAIDAAIKNGMYVIIDWHSHKIHTAEGKDFFTQIASKYKEYPNVIYEIFNEPTDLAWSEIKVYAEELIKHIRSIDPKNIILVGTPNWDQDVDAAADNPIIGYNNIMYTLHFYAATHKDHFRAKADYALKKGLPIFVSECAGMEATGDGAIDMPEWEKWVNWMNDNSLSWIAWSVSDKNESCSMVKDQTSPISKWKETDLKEWGRVVRKTLRGE